MARKILKLLGSSYLAVVLVSALAVVLIWATVVESLSTAERAGRLFYRALWFRLLLGAVGLNVFCALLRRWPFRLRHVGFVMVHSSILLILLGGLVNALWGYEGVVQVREGGQADSMLCRREPVLHVELVDEAVAVDIPADFSSSDDLPAAAVAVGSTGLTVQVLEFLPDAVSASEYPVLVVGFEAGKGPSGVVEIPVLENLNRTVRISSTGLSLRITDYFPHARLGPDGELTDVPRYGSNPAVRFELILPDGRRESQTCFAYHPDFSRTHDRRSRAGVLSRLIMRGSKRLRPADGSAMDVVCPGEARVKGAWPAILVRLRAGAEGKDLWLRYRDAQLLSDATVAQLGSETLIREARIAGRQVRLFFGARQRPLGFAVRLLEFRRINYPGTQRPMRYESVVMLQDGSREVITMNRPLRYRGLKLFQSSYGTLDEAGRVEYSELLVAHNPGTVLQYVGGAVVVLGAVLALLQRFRGRVALLGG